MKVTKQYLKKLIMEELEKEAFDAGTIGAVAVGVPLGLIALDLVIHGLKKTVKSAVDIAYAFKQADEKLTQIRQDAEDDQTVALMVKKFKSDPEIMLLIGEKKFRKAADLMNSKLDPKERTTLKNYSSVYNKLSS